MKIAQLQSEWIGFRIGAFDMRRSILWLGWIACLGAVLHAARYLVLGLHHPLIDFYSFRQTQTALSAYWALHDGFKFDYETPVLGYPWSIPFEFPLYQWLVAELASFGLSIDAAGRLWSFAFFIGFIYPLSIIFKKLKLDPTALPITGLLVFSSPIYVYWSRTVMIESCAVFFGLLWLALLMRFLDSRSPAGLLMTIIAGCCAVLVKSTTFPAFGLVGGLFILSRMANLFRDKAYRDFWLTTAFAALACAVPLAVGYAWVIHTDVVKTQNQLGALLTSAALVPFTFGTWNQRISVELWQNVVFNRVLHDIFGYGWIVALAAIVAALAMRYSIYVWAAVVGFLTPFLLFTNLHMVHTYYQNANAIFALAAAGIAIASLARAGWPWLSVLFSGIVVAGQLSLFNATYASVITGKNIQDNAYFIALRARQIVPPNQGLLVLGQDWSSLVNYYSERKGVALMNWVPKVVAQKFIDNPRSLLDGMSLGGIVYCTDGFSYGESKLLLEDYLKGRKELAVSGTCKLLSAEREPT